MDKRDQGKQEVTDPKRSRSHLNQQMQNYLSDSKSIVEQCVTSVASAPLFSDIFRASLSAESVFVGLSGPNLRPSLNPARSIILRIPMLTAIGQGTIAKAELRRFLELLFWTIYFTDHPVEWSEFKSETSGGFARDQHQPIAHAAHRELGYYLDYTKELMESEPSGLAGHSLNELRQASHHLNAAVHAGQLARAKGKSAPFEKPEPKFLQDFGKLQRTVFSRSCVVFAAYRAARFGALSAAARTEFDWLVGAKLRKQIRSGPFGLK